MVHLYNAPTNLTSYAIKHRSRNDSSSHYCSNCTWGRYFEATRKLMALSTSQSYDKPSKRCCAIEHTQWVRTTLHWLEVKKIIWHSLIIHLVMLERAHLQTSRWSLRNCCATDSQGTVFPFHRWHNVPTPPRGSSSAPSLVASLHTCGRKKKLPYWCIPPNYSKSFHSAELYTKHWIPSMAREPHRYTNHKMNRISVHRIGWMNIFVGKNSFFWLFNFEFLINSFFSPFILFDGSCFKFCLLVLLSSTQHVTAVATET